MKNLFTSGGPAFKNVLDLLHNKMFNQVKNSARLAAA